MNRKHVRRSALSRRKRLGADLVRKAPASDLRCRHTRRQHAIHSRRRVSATRMPLRIDGALSSLPEPGANTESVRPVAEATYTRARFFAISLPYPQVRGAARSGRRTSVRSDRYCVVRVSGATLSRQLSTHGPSPPASTRTRDGARRRARPSASTRSMIRFPREAIHGSEPAAGVRATPPRGSVPFGGTRPGDRLRVGLPRRHLPLSEFLTLSAASSLRVLAVVFQTASTLRLRPSELFPPGQPPPLSGSRALLSLHRRRAGEPAGFGRSASELYSDRTFDTRRTRLTCRRAAALLVFLLFEVYRNRLRAMASPHVLHLRGRFVQSTNALRAAPQGITADPGTDSGEPIQPP